MKLNSWFATAAMAAAVGLLVGCGGSGGDGLSASGGGPGGGSGGASGGGVGTTEEAATARVDVNAATGEVKVTPLNGTASSRSLYTGSSLSVTSSTLGTDAGEVTLRRLNLSIKNNTADAISAGQLIVDRVSSDTGIDLRDLSNVATVIGPGTSSADGPGPSVTISQPTGIARDTDGTVFLAGSGDGTLRKYKDNYVTRIATGIASPGGVEVMGGFAFMVEQSAHNLVRVSTSGGTKFLLAGGGATGYVDGAGATARFNTPRDIEIIGTTGYISDVNNNKIRTAANLTGGSATIGTLNVFPVINGPSGLASMTLAGINWLVVTSTANHKVFLVNSANGQSFAIAGTGALGAADGPGASATFNTPFDAAVSNGAILVSDMGGRKIRQISLIEGAQPQFASSWTVKTVAGAGTNGATDGSGTTAQFGSPRFMDTDGSGAVLIGDLTNNRIRKLTASAGSFPLTGPGGTGTSTGVTAAKPDGYFPSANARKPFYNLGSIAPKGQPGDSIERTVFFAIEPDVKAFSFFISVAADADAPAVLDAVVATAEPFAGSPNVNVRTLAGKTLVGYVDGSATLAQFGSTIFSTSSSVGTFISDFDNSVIRFIDPSNAVYSIAGLTRQVNSAGGNGATSTINSPAGIWSNPDGTELFVCAFNDHVIMRLSRPSYSDPRIPENWTVALIAGGVNNMGNVQGEGSVARFKFPIDITADPTGRTLYVADRENECIRQLKIFSSDKDVALNWNVSIAAGSTSGVAGDADGSAYSARFRAPGSIELAANGDLYVGEQSGYRVRRIDPTFNVTLLAGSASPSGGKVDGVGGNARFNFVYAIALDDAGYLYVGEVGAIRRVSLASGEVRTVAGQVSTALNDGPGDIARFSQALTLATAPGRGLLVGDGPRLRLVERIVRNGPQ